MRLLSSVVILSAFLVPVVLAAAPAPRDAAPAVEAQLATADQPDAPATTEADSTSAIDPRARATRLTSPAFPSPSAGNNLFGGGQADTVPVASCIGQCSYTRRDCSNDCFLQGCASASYSCTDQGAGCEATCVCLKCL